MPNLDFYDVGADHTAVLDVVFGLGVFGSSRRTYPDGLAHSDRQHGTQDRARRPGRLGVDTGLMVLSRRWSWFLVGVGVWTWVIWPRFALAIWNDPRAWSTRVVGEGSPTSFLWVHALLIAVSLAVGTVVGVLGVRVWLAARGSGATGETRRPR